MGIIVLFLQLFSGQSGDQLLTSIRNNYSPVSVFSYEKAQDSLYKVLHFSNDSVECVYSGFKAYLDRTQDASTFVYQNGAGISLEHSFPQSKGAVGNAKSDLHHLFPVKQTVNAARGNSPYGEIPDQLTDTWFKNGISQSTIPTIHIEDWAERDNGSDTFEPREKIKGDVARAVFYFYTIYKFQADTSDPNFFNLEKDILYQWHKNDPPDAFEIWRNDKIGSWQGNRNPFISDTSLVRRAYFSSVKPDTSASDSLDLFISEYVEGSSNNKYIELFNPSLSAKNLADYKLLLYSNGAVSPSTSSGLSGTLQSHQTVVFKNSSATIYSGTSTSVSAVNFNGDDAVVLINTVKNDTLDILGRIGEDPGTEWVKESLSTLNMTLVRNSFIYNGVKHNPTSGFPTLSTEWVSYSIDNVANLGSHVFIDPLPVELSIFSFSVSGNKVVLKWETKSESNNYGWEIEKKQIPLNSPLAKGETNEVSGGFQKIGFVSGKGTTTLNQSHQFTDFSSGLQSSVSGIQYKLKQIDLDGNFSYSNILTINADKLSESPQQLSLVGNYPNPFNPSTVIKFKLNKQTQVVISIFDQLGRKVEILLDSELSEGEHEIEFKSKSYSSGLYFYQIKTPESSLTKSMLLKK